MNTVKVHLTKLMTMNVAGLPPIYNYLQLVIFRCVFPSLFESYIEFVFSEALASKERAKTLTIILAKH